MASADVARNTQDRPSRRRPFASFVKRLANFGHHDQPDKSSREKKASIRARKNHASNFAKNNPYPQSGRMPAPQQSSQPSLGVSEPTQTDTGSIASVPLSTMQEREGSNTCTKSGAPTLATNAETVHSDAGHSKATNTTGGGAPSTLDRAGAGSTFSSPYQSEQSLATTLTTIQSQGYGGNAQSGIDHSAHHNNQSQPMGSAFSHQYPTSPAVSTAPASAIPRHLHSDSNMQHPYSPSASTANVLSDNASILTLASSSKRRRRSMDTDASVRALAPNSVWGGSRESLPLSMLSGNMGTAGSDLPALVSGIPRHSISGANSASAERSGVYTSSSYTRERDSSGLPPSALASERNSFYAKQMATDCKSLRSINNVKDDSRSFISNLDTRSVNNFNSDAKSLHDVASVRSIAPSEARAAASAGLHSRNGSLSGGVGSPSTLNSPSLPRQLSNAGIPMSLSRRSSDWRDMDLAEQEPEPHSASTTADEKVEKDE